MDRHFPMMPEAERRQCIQKNIAEYGSGAAELRWISAEEAVEAARRRRHLLAAAGEGLLLNCHFTKPHLGPLSPGCRQCINGSWSCLFINGRCNCRCFYCPSSQEEIGIPTTQTIQFERAGDYADYIRVFGYDGMSVSGGEPLLTFERTVEYIERVRTNSGEGIHIWMYTNGALVTRDRIHRLHDAGLDEIRFDIGATDYDLGPLKKAVGIIGTVTVEVPAIPEHVPLLKKKLAEMKDAGVAFLNLHQLRLTPHNFPHLCRRGYTFLHGEKVTVLESELAALDILNHAVRMGADLPINYCSFLYKHRYQRAAARRRSAGFVCKDHESITENGYIRSLWIQGNAERIRALDRDLAMKGFQRSLWSVADGGKRIYIHHRLLRDCPPDAGATGIAYFEAVLCPAISYRHFFREIQLNPSRSIFVERRRMAADRILDAGEAARMRETLTGETERNIQAESETERELRGFEQIRPGLQDYF